METIIRDSMKRCCIEGCGCLAETVKIENGVRFRRKYCSKHKRIVYKMNHKSRKRKREEHSGSKRYSKLGKKKMCLLCGWEGPCHAHRMDFGGHYNMNNMASVCPNCHKLIHLGTIVITDEQRRRIVSFNKNELTFDSIRNQLKKS